MTRKMFKNYHTARNINLTVLVVVYLFILAALSGFFSGCQRDCEDTCKVIVSLDGFRWDYSKIYDTPNLQQIAQQGVHALSMAPTFHASTFPMHYTFVPK